MSNNKGIKKSIKIVEHFMVALCPELSQKYLSLQEKVRVMRTVGLNLVGLKQKILKIPPLQMKE